jgi:hypothetical protein
MYFIQAGLYVRNRTQLAGLYLIGGKYVADTRRASRAMFGTLAGPRSERVAHSEI